MIHVEFTLGDRTMERSFADMDEAIAGVNDVFSFIVTHRDGSLTTSIRARVDDGGDVTRALVRGLGSPEFSVRRPDA